MGRHKGVKKYISPRQRELNQQESEVREIAYALKTPEPWAVSEAVETMVPYIPLNAVLVPIPDSSGDTSANRILAERLADRTDTMVLDILGRSEPTIPSHKLRKLGLPGHKVEDHQFDVRNDIKLHNKNVIFIDNVVATGATFDAARNALGTGKGIAFADAGGTVNQGKMSTASKLARKALIESF